MREKKKSSDVIPYSSYIENQHNGMKVGEFAEKFVEEAAKKGKLLDVSQYGLRERIRLLNALDEERYKKNDDDENNKSDTYLNNGYTTEDKEINSDEDSEQSEAPLLISTAEHKSPLIAKRNNISKVRAKLVTKIHAGVPKKYFDTVTKELNEFKKLCKGKNFNGLDDISFSLKDLKEGGKYYTIENNKVIDQYKALCQLSKTLSSKDHIEQVNQTNYWDGTRNAIKRKKGKLLIAVEQAKTQLMLAYMLKSFIDLDISFKEIDDANKKIGLRVTAFTLGAVGLTLYGAAKGYAAMMGLLAAASVKSAAAIAASAATIAPFLCMYWSFETRQLAHRLGIQQKQTLSASAELCWQLHCFDMMCEMLKRSLSVNKEFIKSGENNNKEQNFDDSEITYDNGCFKGRLNSNPPINDNLMKQHANIYKVLKIFKNELNESKDRILESDTKAKKRGKRVWEVVCTVMLGGVNAAFVGFLGLTIVHLASNVAIASLLTLSAAGPLVFGVAIGALIIGCLVGFVVSAWIKNHGTNMVDILSGRKALQEAKKIDVKDKFLNYENAKEALENVYGKNKSTSKNMSQAKLLRKEGMFRYPIVRASEASTKEKPKLKKDNKKATNDDQRSSLITTATN